MRYLLMLFADENTGLAMPPEAMARAMQTMAAYEDALTKAGAFVMTSPLDRTANAKTLAMQGGEVVQGASGAFVNDGGELIVHDGPYAETREQFGGLYIIEAANMDAALAWAAKCPAAQWGSIEVRAMKPGF
ncbi:YciI family protein [Devosia sp.]|uniref:YciI family protein n=1 Tax=Devosia sp. TaxID=1871048 RepID=UPI003263C577